MTTGMSRKSIIIIVFIFAVGEQFEDISFIKHPTEPVRTKSKKVYRTLH